MGTEMELFEQEWAQFCGAKHAVSVGSGLAALELALTSLGVGAGDEVLVPANTFIATWMAVSNVGATPVPVPTSTYDFNLDVTKLHRFVTKKTKALIVVHLYGRPANLDAAMDFGKANGIWVVEDAAQAHGAEFRGQRIGSHSHAVAWSFYPGKNLGAYGDGGAVTTNLGNLASEIESRRNYGSSRKYHHEQIGTNSRLDSIQAAVLRVKLRQLENQTVTRRDVAKFYLTSFQDIQSPMLAPGSIVLPPADEEDFISSWHLFAVRVVRRDHVRRFLHESGIETGVHYPTPPGHQPAYRALFGETVSTQSARDAQSLLSLPIGPHLSRRHLERVITVVQEAVAKSSEAEA